VDVFAELIGLVGILFLIIYPLLHFTQLPDRIPIHFGLDGTPDQHANKIVIWTLPLLGLMTFLGLKKLNNFPHTFNYLQEITLENAKRQYTFASKMIRMLNTIIACVFSYITSQIVQIGFGNKAGLGTYFIQAFLILIIGVTGNFLFQSVKKNEYYRYMFN
jgi:uncharacterized membrane protein